jgi:orotate phosphoribosyltransferase
MGLADLVRDTQCIEYVYGIPSAGIAPATLLALQIDKPLLIKHGGRYYSIDLTAATEWVEKTVVTDLMKTADIIVGTIPFGIIFGIILAEILNKPFVFIRPKPKDHGLGKQVEGLFEKGNTAVLVDPMSAISEGYTSQATEGLNSSGIETISLFDKGIDDFLTPVSEDNFKFAIIVGVDDLVSTGESGINELQPFLSFGARVIPISVFSYELEASTTNFSSLGLINRSVLSFGQLLQVKIKEGNLPEADQEKLWEWHKNQPNWGNENGFLSAKK